VDPIVAEIDFSIVAEQFLYSLPSENLRVCRKHLKSSRGFEASLLLSRNKRRAGEPARLRMRPVTASELLFFCYLPEVDGDCGCALALGMLT
jgi:hypothetical protein